MPVRTRTIITSLALVMVLALSGCGLFSEELATANDTSGLFHVRYPASWQSFVQPGLIALYAADELPTDEDAAFETLSVGVYTASEAATAPVGDRLVELLELRAKDRAWKKQDIGAPAEATIGGREGYSVDVTGTDAKGRAFAGRALLIRTNEREVLAFAVSPESEWSGYTDDVDDLMGEWYWHLRENTTTTTAEPAPEGE